MRIKITHKTFTADTVRKVIALVRPSGISNFNVNVKNSRRGWGGRAYWMGCSYGGNGGRPTVVVRVGKNKFPLRYKPRRAGYLPWIAFTDEEILVHITAHELRHLWQAKHPRGYRVWGARGQFSERDADAYAIRMVRLWRNN